MALLEVLKKHKRICWYPSAGADFRELLFLSKQYIDIHNVPVDKNELPDLFILTDCNPNDYFIDKNSGMTEINKLNNFDYDTAGVLYCSYDRHTCIKHNGFNQIECIDLPFDGRLVSLDFSNNYGKAFFTKASIFSDTLGHWTVDIVYVIIENTAFVFDYLLKNNVLIDYVVRVRYGDNFGGSNVCGDWMLKVLHMLKSKYFLSTEITSSNFDLARSIDLFNYSNETIDTAYLNEYKLNQIYKVKSDSWSKQGDIYWYKLNYLKEKLYV